MVDTPASAPTTTNNPTEGARPDEANPTPERESSAGTPMGSAHHDVPKPAVPTSHPDGTPFTRERPDIDPATGELRGGWTLPPDFDQRPQPEPDQPVEAAEPPQKSDVEAAPVDPPRPKRDARLDGMNALQRTHARLTLEHLEDVIECQCDRCFQRRGVVVKKRRGIVGPSRGGESRASWGHRNDDRPAGSESEQVEDILNTEF